jgi:p-aminobenzoyl-glutamate transporter AbgT
VTDPVPQRPRRLIDRFLNSIERVGNKLPDPALLFVFALFGIWIISWLMAREGVTFQMPTLSGDPKPEAIVNQLSGTALAKFFSNMVETFTSFHPLGVVLVALLGVGVAEESGFINAALKKILSFTPAFLLTPMLILVAIISHTAADAGYVLVIPLGGVLFYAAGRHPLAGIAAAFAGVSGGFSANFIPSGIDPLLQGITQAGANIIDPTVSVNPLCNWLFTAVSSVLIIGIGWYITDRIIEPRLRGTKVDGSPADMPKMEPLTPRESRGLFWALMAFLIGCLILVFSALPSDSVLRSPAQTRVLLKNGETIEGTVQKEGKDLRETMLTLTLADDPKTLEKDAILVFEKPDGGITSYNLNKSAAQKVAAGLKSSDLDDAILIKESRKDGDMRLVTASAVERRETVSPSLTSFAAPIMKMIVPLIFLLFLIPGIVHGFVAGTFKTHRDVIKGMAKSMSTMGYYLVMAFFAALFIKAFDESKVGAWLAVKGADAIRSAGLPNMVTVCGIIMLCGAVNLVVGSASAKWALLAPIFVPMLMQLHVSPELTQAAYRVGDSTTNIVTPLMPYFPLVVAFCQRYVKGTGIGTLISIMLPYSIAFFILWSAFLMIYWQLGIPLGIDASYVYPRGG